MGIVHSYGAVQVRCPLPARTSNRTAVGRPLRVQEDSLNRANKRASEAIDHVRTVQAFAAEPTQVCLLLCPSLAPLNY
jgi:hypothetical protein